jgi:TrpR family trp operon transcriptional repressor
MVSSVDDVVWQLLQAENKQEMENLVLGLFTPAEIDEFSRRLRLVKLLKQGVSQHEIARQLGIGVATVTRGSRELKLGRFKFI